MYIHFNYISNQVAHLMNFMKRWVKRWNSVKVNISVPMTVRPWDEMFVPSSNTGYTRILLQSYMYVINVLYYVAWTKILFVLYIQRNNYFRLFLFHIEISSFYINFLENGKRNLYLSYKDFFIFIFKL